VLVSGSLVIALPPVLIFQWPFSSPYVKSLLNQFLPAWGLVFAGELFFLAMFPSLNSREFNLCGLLQVSYATGLKFTLSPSPGFPFFLDRRRRGLILVLSSHLILFFLCLMSIPAISPFSKACNSLLNSTFFPRTQFSFPLLVAANFWLFPG